MRLLQLVGSLFSSRGCGDGSAGKFKELVLVGEFLATSERDMARPRAKRRRPDVHSGRQRPVDRAANGRSRFLCSSALGKARSH